MSFRVNLEIISSKSGDAYHISGLTTALESGRKRQKNPKKQKKGVLLIFNKTSCLQCMSNDSHILELRI